MEGCSTEEAYMTTHSIATDAVLSSGCIHWAGPLKPFEQFSYIGSPIKVIRENTKYPRGLPSAVVVHGT